MLRRREGESQQAYDNHRRKEQKRQEFLRVLTRRHAERWGLSADVARKHIDQVSITSRRAVRDELGLD
jgi:hypothetical protein